MPGRHWTSLQPSWREESLASQGPCTKLHQAEPRKSLEIPSRPSYPSFSCASFRWTLVTSRAPTACVASTQPQRTHEWSAKRAKVTSCRQACHAGRSTPRGTCRRELLCLCLNNEARNRRSLQVSITGWAGTQETRPGFNGTTRFRSFFLSSRALLVYVTWPSISYVGSSQSAGGLDWGRRWGAEKCLCHWRVELRPLREDGGYRGWRPRPALWRRRA